MGFGSQRCRPDSNAAAFGDRAPLDKSELGWLSYAALVDALASGGHPAEARLVVDRARALIADQLAKPRVEYQDPDFDQEMVVEHLLTLGDRPAALKAASEVVAMPPRGIHKRDSIDEIARSAFRKIATDALRAGDKADYLAARKAAVETLARPLEWQVGRIPDWCRVCLRADDREGFDVFANAMRDELKKNTGPFSIMDVMEKTDLAALFWAAGEKDQYSTLIGGLEKDLGKAAGGDGSAAENFKKYEGEEYFLLAAAYARAGDKPAVDRNVALALKAARLDDGELSDRWNEIAFGYAEAGLLDDAVTAEAKVPDKAYRSVAVEIARRLATAGRIDDAWRLAWTLTPRDRAVADYQLAVDETGAGKTDDLAVRADAAPTPHERVLIEMAAARTLLGKQYSGLFKIYRPADS